MSAFDTNFNIPIARPPKIPGNPQFNNARISQLRTDNIIGNFSSWKDPVRVTTDGSNLTLRGLQTVNGISLVEGDRILIRDQTIGSQNGIYNVRSSDWTRTEDLIKGVSAAGIAVISTEGSIGSDTAFVCTSNEGSAVVGTNSLSFSALSGGSGSPGGSSTNVQFNSGGLFAGSSDFTWSGSAIGLSRSATTSVVSIQASTDTGNYTLTLPVDDGTTGQFLSTDGTGILSWATSSGGTSTSNPGGPVNAVQFNEPFGSFNGSSKMGFLEIGDPVLLDGNPIPSTGGQLLLGEEQDSLDMFSLVGASASTSGKSGQGIAISTGYGLSDTDGGTIIMVTGGGANSGSIFMACSEASQDGGGVTFISGNSVPVGSATGSGGGISLSAGSSTSGSGGSLTFTAGTAGPTTDDSDANGGSFSFTARDAGTSGGFGGGFQFQGGRGYEGTGPVTSLTINYAGTGYPDGPTLGLTTSGGSGTGLTVDVAAIAGLVTTATINNSGSGYTVGDIVTVLSGTTGNDATLYIQFTTGAQGQGGQFIVTCGDSDAFQGGSVEITTGDSVQSSGGDFTVTCGDAQKFSSDLDVGGSVSIACGDGSTGGSFTLTAGDSFQSGSQDAGSVSITAGSLTKPGSPFDMSGTAGSITMTAGSAPQISGSVSSFIITNGGTGYVTANDLSTSTVGSGTGLDVDITATTSTGEVTFAAIGSPEFLNRGINYNIGDTVTIDGGNNDATLLITGLTDNGTCTPGDVTILAGDNYADGNGGSIILTAGLAANGQEVISGNGGDITLVAGECTNDGDGGNISITGGIGNDNGGSVNINGGNANLLNGGDVNINGGSSTSATVGGIYVGGFSTSRLQFFSTMGATTQVTNGVTASTGVQNTGSITVNENTTFDGYTIGQIVAALQAYGLLA